MLQVENGRTEPMYSDLLNLASALDVDLSQLVDAVDAAGPTSTTTAPPSHRRPTSAKPAPGQPVHVTGPTMPSLTGRWWAAWQTFNQGQEIIATQPIEIEQHGLVANVTALERSEENVRGGYLWAGQVRLCENHVLIGWYTATDQNVRSRGTMYFVLHPQGNLLEGRWTGTSYDGPIVSGWGAIARAQDEATSTVTRLKSAVG